MIICNACNGTGLEQSIENTVAKICSFCYKIQDIKKEKFAITYSKCYYNKEKNIFSNKNYTIYENLNFAKNDQDFLNKKYNIIVKIIPL